MSLEVKIIIDDDDRNSVLSDNYLIRCSGCNRILKKNNIPKLISDLRRVFRLITMENHDINLLKKALSLLETYILTYKKDIDFTKLDLKEINELFYDACYDYKTLSIEKFSKYIQNGADIFYESEPINSKKWLSQFHYVSKSSNIQLIKEFLTRGANVNSKFSENETGTIWNLNHDLNLDKIKLFIEYGANVNSQKSNGKTVLHEACESYNLNIDIIKYLIDKQADLNLKDSNGKSALHFASKTNNKEVILLLIDKGINVNITDNYGNTPLMLATESNLPLTVKILIDKRADQMIKNLNGQTAYDLALNNKLIDVLNVFDSENVLNDFKRKKLKEIEEIKMKIINMLKSGKCISTTHKEGSERFYFENGVYKFSSYDDYGDPYENIYKTDDEALKWLQPKFDDELDGWKYVLRSF